MVPGRSPCAIVDWTPRIARLVAHVCAAMLCCVLLAACATVASQESVFSELVYGNPQGARPAQSHKARAEYPNLNQAGAAGEEYPAQDRVRGAGYQGFGTRANGAGFEVNFDNAELQEVVKVILRDTLNIDYIIDPNVQGKVTLSAARPLSETQLLDVLESVLQMNRAAMVREGELYRIITDATLRAGGAGSVSYAAERRQIGPGYGISVLPLEHVAAPEMLRLLASFVAEPRSLRAEVNRNLLLIRGTAAERANLLDVSATFDVDWLSGQSAGIYRLLYASPDEMVHELSRVFRVKPGAIGEDLIRFEPIKRLNAVLVLTKRRKLLEKAAAWVKRLDKTDPLAENVYVYRVEHTNAARLADILNKMFGGQITSERAPEAEVAPGQQATLTSSTQGSLSGGLGEAAAVQSPGQSGNGGGIATPAVQRPGRGANAGENIQVVADEIQNKLLIRASLLNFKKVLGVLQRLDRPSAQVLIKATLAEVQLNKNLRYGVQLFLQERHNTPEGVLGFSNGASLTIQPQLPGLNFIVGLPDSPKVILDALQNQTSVRIVSSPSVVVVNNESATLQVGDDVPISTRQAVSVTDPEAPIVNNIEFRKTGVILKVTPRINSDGLVTMEVEQEISAVTGATTEGQAGTLTPTISQRRVASTISVYSGQMVVLGGLVTERANKFANRVPIIERIPLLGDALGKTDDKGDRTELVVFIQPQVIRDAADATMIANELRHRLGLLAPDDRRRNRVLQFQEKWHVQSQTY